ncbi:MAG TPA: hypothetical protein VN310_12065 [Candidatus Dormibacteraeota bacterium]|jgi:hypothetical protein|nr:hypothetical protein [Candidatus Dormibacteraeota bacterium]
MFIDAIVVDWIYELVKGLGGAVLGFAGGVAMEKYKKAQSKDEDVAEYLTKLMGALTGMVEAFREGKLPRVHGNVLKHSLARFSEATRRVLGRETETELIRLSGLVASAEAIDGSLMVGRNVESDIQEWIATAERLIARLQVTVMNLGVGLKASN